jgi:hypothetical protein
MEQRTALMGSEGRCGSVAPGGPALAAAIPQVAYVTTPAPAAAAVTATNWSAFGEQSDRDHDLVFMPKHGTRRLRSLSP